MVSNNYKQCRVRSLVAAFATLALVVLTTSAASADERSGSSGAATGAPDDDARATARELMTQGRTQRKQGDLKGALESFNKANELMRVPTTLYEVAATQAELGQLVGAYYSLQKLLESKPALDEPTAFERARLAARSLFEKLEARTPALYVSFEGLASGESIELLVDGKKVAPDIYKSGIRLDPGDHSIAARTRSAKVEEAIHISENEKRKLLLDLNTEEIEVPKKPLKRRDAEQEPAPVQKKSRSILVPVMGGVALLGVGTGTVFALLGRSNENALKDECAPSCLEASVQKVQTMYTVANIGFGVGIAAAASAVVIFAVQSSSKTTEKLDAWAQRKLSVDVASLPGGGGLFSAKGQF